MFLIKTIYKNIVKNTTEAEPYIISFGYVLLILYPGFYLFNHLIAAPIGNENLYLRLIIGVIGVTLILKKSWIKGMEKYLPIYWYFSLLISLPFFFTYMLLNNQEHTVWYVNSLVGMSLLMLFVDWKSYILLSIIGILCGMATIYIINNQLKVHHDLSGVLASYIVPVIYFFIFSNKKNLIYFQKLETLRGLGGKIAHEMRTPLASILANLNALDNILPKLVNCYKIAQKNIVELPTIKEKDLNIVVKIPSNIKKINEEALLIIDMLLAKLTDNIKNQKFTKCSINNCIKKALTSYPLNDEQKKLINYEENLDFEFIGDEQLIIHIFYNLIKNSLYYINIANKGNILISIQIMEKEALVLFKDTGQGIPKHILPNIFDIFFTNTRFGTGLGLAFCKMVMESLGGEIRCYSIEGEYTEFSLFFPISVKIS